MRSVMVFSGPASRADMIRLYLERNGISAWLDNEALGTWAPHYSPGGGFMGVKVMISSADVARADELLKQLNAEKDGPPPSSWTCPQCGEEMEGTFTQCWNCSTARDRED